MTKVSHAIFRSHRSALLRATALAGGVIAAMATAVQAQAQSGGAGGGNYGGNGAAGGASTFDTSIGGFGTNGINGGASGGGAGAMGGSGGPGGNGVLGGAGGSTAGAAGQNGGNAANGASGGGGGGGANGGFGASLPNIALTGGNGGNGGNGDTAASSPSSGGGGGAGGTGYVLFPLYGLGSGDQGWTNDPRPGTLSVALTGGAGGAGGSAGSAFSNPGKAGDGGHGLVINAANNAGTGVDSLHLTVNAPVTGGSTSSGGKAGSGIVIFGEPVTTTLFVNSAVAGGQTSGGVTGSAISYTNSPDPLSATHKIVIGAQGSLTGNIVMPSSTGGGLIISNANDYTYNYRFIGSDVPNGNGATYFELFKEGAGTLTLTQSQNIFGTVTIRGGRLLLGANATLGPLSSVVLDGGVFDPGAQTVTVNGNLTGSGQVFVGTGGTTTLNGDNSGFTGNIYVSGKLVLGSNQAAGGASGSQIITTGSVVQFADGVNSATPIAINSNTTQLEVLTSATATQSGVISELNGPRPIEKIGGGTLILTANNTYTGVTTISAGTLQVGAGARAGTLGTGNVVNNGALVFNRSDPVVVANAISGSGGVTFSGSGTVTLSAANSYVGPTSITGGAVSISAAANLGDAGNGLTLDGGRLIATNHIAMTRAVGVGSNGGSIDVQVTGLNINGPAGLTLDGGVAYTGALRKLGAGVLRLNAAGTGSGGLMVEAGTLNINNATAAGTGTIALSAGTTLTTDGASALTLANPISLTDVGARTLTVPNIGGARLTLAGPISGDGSLSLTGGDVALSGTNSFTGGVTVSSGRLGVGSNTALGTGTLRLSGGAGFYTSADNIRLANPVEVSGLHSFAVNAGRTLTLDGALTGAGAIRHDTGGTIAFNSLNSFSGGLTLVDGTLVAGVSGALGTGPIYLHTSGAGTPTLRTGAEGVVLSNAIQLNNVRGAVIDTQAYRLTLTGVISNGQILGGGEGQPAGSGLTKTGSGTLVLSGTSTYTGQTIVNAGRLIVNGSIRSSSGVTIGEGALLGGNGDIPTLTVNGTISPGNSVGVLNINGGLKLAPTATTVIEIEGATADRINVTGNATLAGTLQLVAGGGTYAFTTPYTILSATGTSSGTFAAVNTTGSFGVGVTSAVSYGAQNVQVTLTPAPLVTVAPDGPTTLDVAPTTTSSTETPGPTTVTTDSTTVAAPTTTTQTTTVLTQQTPVLGFNQTRNITAVAAALDRAAFSGSDMSSLFRVYNQPTREALAAAVNSLSGEVHTATTAAGLRASDQFLRVMLDPFAIGRDGSLVGTSGYGGFTADLPGRKGPIAAPAPVRFEPTFHVWGASFGQIDRTKGDATGAGSATRETKDANIAVGADYRIAPGSVVGFALSGGQSRAELGRNLGSNNADVFQLGLYGATKLGALNLAASLSYAALQVETRRNVPALGLGALGNYNAQVWGGRLQAAYDLFSAGGFTVSPIAALQIQSVNTPNFRETNGLTGTDAGVTGRSHTNTALRSDLGLRLTSLTTLGGRKVTLFTEIAWAHYYQRNITFAASVSGIANTNFVIEGARSDRDAGLFSAGADIQLTPNLTLGGRFDASVSGNARSFAGTGALRASF